MGGGRAQVKERDLGLQIRGQLAKLWICKRYDSGISRT